MRLFALPALLLLPALPSPADDIQTITITTPPGQMKYDRPVIKAPPGGQLKLVFQNHDAMPHNIVFCHPKEGAGDRGLDVAMEAWKLAEQGEAKAWVPEHPRIWAHSRMVPAHGQEEFTIKVPDQPGIYPYVCTFPGHAMAMNGELRVESTGPGFSDLGFKLYLGDWTNLPDFSALKPHREGPVSDKKMAINLEGMSEHFGIRWDGRVEAPADGFYLFTMSSDDGSRLFVDGKAVIENDGIHSGGDLKVGRVKLPKGPHTVRVDYFEQSGEEEIYLGWAGPKFSETALSKWIHPSRKGGGEVEAGEQRNRGIPLAPENGEAVIYRNFINGVSPRGIAVGYPNGVNICFDADQMSHGLMWRGAFIDAKQQWSDRGAGQTQPLGFDVVRVGGDGQGMAVLADANAPWPPRQERAAGLQFLGYRLDAKRFPTFRYRMGGLLVEEHYEPAGDYKTSNETVTRVLKLTGIPDGNVFIRAATGGMRKEGDLWLVGGRISVRLSGGEPVLRQNNELLVKPSFTNDRAEVRIGLAWTN
jgi:plastocyanin